MQQVFDTYISEISKKYSREETSEYGYRTPFENFLKEIFKDINIDEIDHDPKAENGNKPDFTIKKKDIALLHIETKDIGISLDKVEKSPQMSRYYGYENLVLTDYLEFRFYRNGERYEEPIEIGKYNKKDRSITPFPENYEHLARTLKDFTKSSKEPIKSGKHLAKIMGGKAQRIRDNVKSFLSSDAERNNDIIKVYQSFKKLLVHDLDESSFADMYAQTLVYGLFVARYYDNSSDNFTRQEARDLIPNSNPFLRSFFDHIVGPDFDERLEHIVDELCLVFLHSDVKILMEEYLKDGKSQDPVIHFYEDFLNEYDPQLRKKMGAYYTPQPVVNFIIRSVDHILKKDFHLPEGLVDNSKDENSIHKVQILDPAVGTGTFISTILNYMYGSIKQSNKPGRWDGTYIHHEILPRIHGFELMMTPYTIAHLKISMAFAKTGFIHFNRRFGIYLTNSLEKNLYSKDLIAFGLAESISKESKEASKIKEDTPIMVVVGNPPYSVSSSNKGEWIQDLIKVYKKDLNERKINLDDDYIKFIRLAENYIERNGTGIVGMITNNSFIDGITHRQMRKHLLETFDDIYILDLHGNSKKRETCPDGSKDENVFDIMQGVSINIFVRKNKEKNGLGKVHHTDLYGTREKKFEALTKGSIKTVNWDILDYKEPYYFFVPKDFELIEEYHSFFQITDLLKVYGPGVKTERDKICIKDNLDELKEIINNFYNLSEQELIRKYSLYDSRDWKVQKAKKDVISNYTKSLYYKIQYRPFDYKWIWYSGKSKGFVGTPGYKIGQNLLQENIALITSRTVYGNYDWNDIFITKYLVEFGIMATRIGNTAPVLPLYLYSSDGSKTPNLNQEIVDKIEKIVGKTTPENIFDYIYAVLHSPKYREKYKEFLKIDFPRVPYPKDRESFKKLIKIGKELRELHLMESPKLDKNDISFPVSGTKEVTKVIYKDNKVYINDEQYFGNVPKVAWNFYIGGYQPAQKWLKDRKGRILNSDDIDHYAKIITILMETDRIMKDIDKI